MSKKTYNENSIVSLSPRDFTRLRPEVYCGDTSDATQLFVEVFSNALDEATIGNATTIKVDIDNDKGYVRVEDNGQGFIPNSFRDDEKTILEAAFSVMNTSGKYDAETGVYEGSSLGSFGIGSKITCYLSSKSSITSWRDGDIEKVEFTDGEFSGRPPQEKKDGSGTIVEWFADSQFFGSPTINLTKAENLIKTTVSLCQGLTVILNGKEYKSEHGLDDLVDAAVKGKEILSRRFRFNEGTAAKLNLIMTYTNAYSPTIVPYVNTGLTESGPHITLLKTTITRIMNKYFRDKKWLKEKDNNLSGDEVQEGMYIIFNLTSKGVAYDAQVKSRLTKFSDEAKELIKTFGDELYDWLDRNERESKLIADRALEARKAKEAAKKARENVRKPQTKKKKSLKDKIAMSDKFYDSVEKRPENRNLYICEGASALGSLLEARNVKTDALYAVRGKIVSIKAGIEKILANQEISNIIDIIGAGFGNDVFDVGKMRVDKVIIAADQDFDGDHISLLFMALMYTYMRPLVLAGKLYRLETPLYIIEQKGRETLYLFSQKDMDEWLNDHPNSNARITRNKGLGEVNPEILKTVCMEPQTLTQITVADVEKTAELVEVLEGKDVEPRKKFLYDNAENFGFDLV